MLYDVAMILSLVAAVSENRVIGNQNTLPWHLPDDLAHFRRFTLGKPIIMGRKTFESIGKVLSQRTNIVITRGEGSEIQKQGALVAHSVAEALECARRTGADEACIIGGADVYAQTMHIASRLCLTIVHAEVQGDAFFPEISPLEWRETSREEHPADSAHAFPFSFVSYEKRLLVA